MAAETKTQRDHRTLVIKNFRNFAPFCAGTKDDTDDLKEFLELNRGLSRDEIGGLVTLISGNNCGKSNLLDALERYNTQAFKKEDYTDFVFAEVKPSVGMNVANGAYGNLRKSVGSIVYEGGPVKVLLALALEKESYDYYLQYLNDHQIQYHYVQSGKSQRGIDNQRKIEELPVINYIHNMFNSLRKSLSRQYEGSSVSDDYFVSLLENRKGIVFDNSGILPDCIRNKNSFNYRDKTVRVVSTGTPIDDHFFKKLKKHITSDENRISVTNSNSILGEVMDILSELEVSYAAISEPDSTGNDKFTEKFGYEISDTVRRYDRVKIKQKDLVCKPDQPNQFMLNLLKILDYEKGALDLAYSGAGNLRYKLENDLNRALKEVSDELNDLLNINDKKYTLRIKLERENIELFITRGDGVPLNLDRQSEGFTWLFDLYFNLIKLERFNPGDIILLDEFGNSLSFSTIKELTKKLREYAKKNGLTFVLATQNPMAIDIHHLDEVRLLVPRDDGSTHIINNFDRFGGDENHDILAPILGGLTVSRNYMRSDNRKTVFVEGATDYFYLTAFCEALRLHGTEYDIDFIPINGVGNKKNSPKNIVGQILSIERNPTIFTDSDYAGAEFKKAAESKHVSPSSISEVLGNDKKVIEDVFSSADAEKLGIRTKDGDSNKKFDHAACLSYKIPQIYDELEDETKSNFMKIIDYVMDQ